MRQSRVLLHDEVATQLTQAFAGKPNVVFEVRKNSTSIRFDCAGPRTMKGLCPDPRYVAQRGV